MNWEKLRSDEFKSAVERSGGLCVIPIGCVEKHGEHLPLGTDYFEVKTHVELAAQIEDFVIFPVAPWLGDMMDVQSLDCFKYNHGSIALSQHTLLTVLEELCDQIGRNGFTKILFVNCHGGNVALLDYFLRAQGTKKRDYITMVVNSYEKTTTDAKEAYKYFSDNRADYPMLTDTDMQVLKTYADSPDGFAGGHGDFTETAWVMGAYPELVATDRYELGDGKSTGRIDHLKKLGVKVSCGWQANHPAMLSGKPAHGCSKTIGEAFNLYCGRRIANIVKVIKEDDDVVTIAQGNI